MRLHRRVWLSHGVPVGLGILLAAGLGGAEQTEYVITFDRVAVRGFIGLYDTPEVAHREPTAEEKPPPAKPTEGSVGG